MARRDLVRVEAEFVAYLRAVHTMGNDIGVRYGSWKGYWDDVVSCGEAFVTAKILKRIIEKIADVPPLPPDGKAVLRRCLGTERDLDRPAANFGKNPEFRLCYDRELCKIREARVAAAGRRPDGNAASMTSVGVCPVPPLAASPAISLWRLPATGPVFVGRENELRQLDAALMSPTTHAVTVVGLPGSGKSALINEWLLRLGSGFGGMESVAGWRFSATESLSHSLIVEQMLVFFGDPDPESGAAAVRAERLVKRIRDRRAIVALGSLEAVQDPVSHAIQVEPVMILVRELARHLNGLLVMTSCRQTQRGLDARRRWPFGTGTCAAGSRRGGRGRRAPARGGADDRPVRLRTPPP